MEDKPFKEITLMTRQLGKMKVITSIMQAAEFIVNQWPGTDTEKLDIAKHALLDLRRGSWSPAIKRQTGKVAQGKDAAEGIKQRSRAKLRETAS